MSMRTLSRSKFGYETLAALANAPAKSFTLIHGEVGCTGRSLSATLRQCEAEGLIASVAPRKGYHLTSRGRLALAHWSALLAMDGEPEQRGIGARVELSIKKQEAYSRVALQEMMDSAAVKSAVARVGSGGALGPVPSRTVATDPECNKTFTELDEDPFAPKGGDQ